MTNTQLLVACGISFLVGIGLSLTPIPFNTAGFALVSMIGLCCAPMFRYIAMKIVE